MLQNDHFGATRCRVLQATQKISVTLEQSNSLHGEKQVTRHTKKSKINKLYW